MPPPREQDRLDVVPVSAVENCLPMLPWPEGDFPAVSERALRYRVGAKPGEPGGHQIIVRFRAVRTTDLVSWRWQVENKVVPDEEFVV